MSAYIVFCSGKRIIVQTIDFSHIFHSDVLKNMI